MLETIKTTLDNLVGFVDTIWQFVVDFTSDTFEMIKLVGETVAKIPSYFNWLPAPALAGILTIFGVVVIYKILGRE